MDTMWIVTGVNRLTGVRERCSMVAPLSVARELLAAQRKAKGGSRAYSRLRLEAWEPEICFKKK